MLPNLLTHNAPSCSMRLLECSSSALMSVLSPSFEHSSSAACGDVLKFFADLIFGALVFCKAEQLLVPFSALHSLAHLVDERFLCCGQPQRTFSDLLKSDRLVVLTKPRDVPQLIKLFPDFKNVCICVPSGPLSSRMLFDGKYLEEFYAEEFNPALSALADAGPYSVTAWMRSALTCRYEGLYVPSVRVAETAAKLLSIDIGGERGSCRCNRVVLEEGVCGLTPRWLETVVKTVASCGVSISSSIGLALCDRNCQEVDENYLLSKATGMGISCIAATAVPAPLFPRAERLISTDSVASFVSGWNDAAGAGVAAGDDLDWSEDCVEYCTAIRDRWKMFNQ
ncbi:hypothetical protein TRVL_09188 [Trypanosoma vivax]|nr:hypothetical protein TRVL_09188 [Trypanosoma vivax]